MTDLIKEDLKNQRALVLDGAMATELEKRGVDTTSELWSATALFDQQAAVKAVHRSYFEAGADIAITNTYQANIKGFLKAGFSEAQSETMIKTAVKVALEARDEFYSGLSKAVRANRATHPLVIGSVGPYGAYLADGSEYTGAYDLTKADYQAFHRRRMQLLAEAGVDGFAFETQPNFDEAKELGELLETEFANQHAWVSFSVSDPEHLCDGTPLAKAVAFFDAFSHINAIGVNCTSMNQIEAVIKVVAANTSKPIIVYPNNGDVYDPQTKTWTPNPSATTFSELVPSWLNAGAKIIGGCCRTTPADIEEIRRSVYGD